MYVKEDLPRVPDRQLSQTSSRSPNWSLLWLSTISPATSAGSRYFSSLRVGPIITGVDLLPRSQTIGSGSLGRRRQRVWNGWGGRWRFGVIKLVRNIHTLCYIWREYYPCSTPQWRMGSDSHFRLSADLPPVTSREKTCAWFIIHGINKIIKLDNVRKMFDNNM